MSETKIQKGQNTATKAEKKWAIADVEYKKGSAVAGTVFEGEEVVTFPNLICSTIILQDGADPDSDAITEQVKTLREAIPTELKQALGIAR